MGEAKPIKVFDNVLIAGGVELALQRTLSAYRLYDPERSDKLWKFTKSIAAQENPPGKRVWWRGSPDAHGVSGYISLDPGEYRTEEPTGGNDVTMDPPENDDSPALSVILTAILEESKLDYVPQTAMLRRYQEAATRVLQHGKQVEFPEAAQRFSEAASKARSGDESAWPALIKFLYDDCLFDHGMPIILFSQCMLLLQLQGICGAWIEQDCFKAPLPYLRGLVKELSQDNSRTKLAEVLSTIGRSSYRDANNNVKLALASYSLSSTTAQLVQACHLFFTALLVAKLEEEYSLNADLGYSTLLADEGFACTQTGLLYGVQFFTKKPSATVREIVWNLADGEAVPKIIRRFSSPIFPAIGNFLARTLVAAARIETEGSAFDLGLKQLLELEQEANGPGLLSIGEFESSWLDQCLLNAYKKLGDENNTRRYAVKIATRLVLGKSMNQ
jgi:hypothetical protein